MKPKELHYTPRPACALLPLKWSDNSMPLRDWSKFDSPARERREKLVQRETPALLRRQAS